MSQQLQWVGTFPRESCAQLVAEIERQKVARRDYIYPASKLSVDNEGNLLMQEVDGFKVGDTVYTEWAQAESAATASGQKLEHVGKVAPMQLSQTAHRQLCERLGVSHMGRYVAGLRAKGHGDLAATNFQTLLSRETKRFLVRTLDGRARAILSDSYRILDNGDLFFCAAETLQQVNADIWNARLSEDRFQLLAVSPHIRGEVTTDRTFDPGDGWESRWAGGEGDVHNAALSISNSETGNGCLSVNPAIMRKVCANFNVWTNGVAEVHLGRQKGEEGLILGDDTRAAEAKTIWLKIRDVIKTTFNPEKFKEYIERLNRATTREIPAGNVEKAVDNVVQEYEISNERRNSILANLLRTGDRTQYGLIQAVTSTAHDADRDGNPDTAYELEAIGAKLADIDAGRFGILAGV